MLIILLLLHKKHWTCKACHITLLGFGHPSSSSAKTYSHISFFTVNALVILLDRPECLICTRLGKVSGVFRCCFQNFELWCHPVCNMRTTTNKDITTGIQPHTSEERIQIPKTDNFIIENRTFGFLFFFFFGNTRGKDNRTTWFTLKGITERFPRAARQRKTLEHLIKIFLNMLPVYQCNSTSEEGKWQSKPSPTLVRQLSALLPGFL